MKIKNVKIILFILIVLLVMFFVIYYVEGEMINSTKSRITESSLNFNRVENEQNSATDTLNSIQNQLEENNSKLLQLKSGDKYRLHDPTMQEVTDFLNNSEDRSIGSLRDLRNLINNSKNQGIRCAYVMLYMTYGDRSHLIGFDTVDEGMICYEWGIFKAIPKIGSYYYECVFDDYYRPAKNDIISDIVVVGLNGYEEELSTNTDTTPVITSFYIEPQSIDNGDIAELHWVVSNARSVSIDNGIGYVGFIGSRIVTPETTTSYTITATNGDKVMYATAQLTVIQIDYKTLLIGEWKMVTMIDWYAFDDMVFWSNNTCTFLVWNKGRLLDPGYPCQYSVEGNSLRTYSDTSDMTWTLSWDGTYLTMIYTTDSTLGGTYRKIS